MRRPPPRSTRTYTRLPHTTLFRSPAALTPPLAPPPHIQARSAPLQNPTPPSTHCGASKCQHLNHPRRKSPAASSWKERSEEHTSELQSLMRISYAVFCLKKNNIQHEVTRKTNIT